MAVWCWGRMWKFAHDSPAANGRILGAGQIDGYCAGEPWNQQTVSRGIGQVAVTSYDLWNNGPEKVLGVTQAWAEANPETHQALLCALLEAAQWLDEPHNRVRIAELLTRPEYLDVPLALIQPPLLGRYRYAPDEPERLLPDFNVFARYAANFPWHSHGSISWHKCTQQVSWQLCPLTLRHC